MSATATQPLELENLGSIITIKGTDSCLGALWDTRDTGKGIWCPSYGEVSRWGVTSEYAKAHNKALDEAMLKGLDENCQIGQGNSFYLKKTKRENGYIDYSITTFCGAVVADSSTGGVTVTKTKTYYCRLGTYQHKVWFWRSGKQFKGVNNGSDDLVHFKRVK